jgi:hypothetical protein
MRQRVSFQKFATSKPTNGEIQKGGDMKKVLLLPLLAIGLAVVPMKQADAQVSVGVGPVGFGYPAYGYSYYGYPGYRYYPRNNYRYYGSYPYYRTYYNGRPYYGHRYHRHHNRYYRY